MKKRLLLLSFFYLNLAFANPAAEIQAKLNAIKSMTADFQQTVYAGSRTLSTAKGNMALLRPNKFRWYVKKPMEQLVIADSQKIWVYDIDLEQVTVKKQVKNFTGTPALFLSGSDNRVSRDFTVSKIVKNKQLIFSLQAKSAKENYQRLKLSFTAEQLDGLEFFDQLGQHTVVTLTKVKANTALSPVLFQFKIPPGVDVIQQ